MLFASSARWPLILLGVLAGLLGSVPAACSQEIHVSLAVILASTTDKHVDCELKCIATEIHKMHPELIGFRLGPVIRKSVAVGKKEEIPLIDDEVATIRVRHGADSKNRVSVSLKPPRMGELDYTTCCGKFFPLLTGYETKKKEHLIVAVKVQPCKGDK